MDKRTNHLLDKNSIFGIARSGFIDTGPDARQHLNSYTRHNALEITT